MKITARILIIIGWLMVAFNIMAYLGNRKEPSRIPDRGGARIGYIIGSNLFFIVGGLLLIIGYRLWRKAKMAAVKNDLLDNFLDESPKNTGA